MAKKDLKKTVLIIFVCISLPLLLVGFIVHNFVFNDFSVTENSNDCKNHIVVLGTYENELFLRQVCEGVEKNCDAYNAVVEFYVPESSAKDVSLQELFDYAAFVNADGIIAYIPSASDSVNNVCNIDGVEIPIVTTGAYSTNTQMISYIGISYWELGHKFGEEIENLLGSKGTVYILCSENSSNPNFSNLTNSIQTTLGRYPNIGYKLVNEISENLIKEAVASNTGKLQFVALTEEDTIQLAQYSTEFGLNKNDDISIIGFGSNEPCQFYLAKGLINELISLDPEKIGESALKEIYEYKNIGYANSYMAADIKILKADNNENK